MRRWFALSAVVASALALFLLRRPPESHPTPPRRAKPEGPLALPTVPRVASGPSQHGGGNGREIAIRVVDVEGHAVANATVVACVEVPDWLEEYAHESPHALDLAPPRDCEGGTIRVADGVTDETGSVGLRTAAYSDLHASDSRGWKGSQRVNHRDAIVVLIAPTAILHGRVRGPTGAPIPHATVGTAHGSEGPDHAFGPSTTTDGDGAYRLETAATGLLWVTAVASGFAANAGAAQVTPGNETRVDLSLSPGVRMAGRVEDDDGAPIGGAYVAADDRTGVVTGSDGNFTIESLPPADSVDLRVDAEGFFPEFRHAKPDERTVVRMNRGRTIAIDVHADLARLLPGEDTTKEPRVFLGELALFMPRAGAEGEYDEGWSEALVVDGRRGTAHFEALGQRDGAHRLQVSAPGVSVVVPVDGDHLSLSLPLPDSPSIQGMMRDAHGAPIAHGFVSLDRIADTITDGAGRFEFSSVDPGMHDLEGTGPGACGHTRASAGESSVILELDAPKDGAAAASTPGEPPRSGVGLSLTRAADGRVLVWIAPSAPLSEHLWQGDVVTAIDGAPPPANGDPNAALYGAAGTTVTVSVIRPSTGESITASLRRP